MKKILGLLFVLTYFSITGLSAYQISTIFIDEQSNAAQEDFYDIFCQMQDMNIIPTNLTLNALNLSKNSGTLLQLFDFIQQNPNISPDKNIHTKNFFNTLEKVTYFELRQFINKFRSKEGLNGIIKAKALMTLHDMYTFKAQESTGTDFVYPFRAIITQIFVYASYINNSSFSYEKKNDSFGFFMDKTYQEIVRIKEAYPNCSITTEDISSLTTIIKSFSIQKSILRKYLIKAGIAAATVTAIVLVGWLFYKFVWPKIKRWGSRSIKSAILGPIDIEIVETDEHALAILASASETEIGFKDPQLLEELTKKTKAAEAAAVRAEATITRTEVDLNATKIASEKAQAEIRVFEEDAQRLNQFSQDAAAKKDTRTHDLTIAFIAANEKLTKAKATIESMQVTLKNQASALDSAKQSLEEARKLASESSKAETANRALLVENFRKIIFATPSDPQERIAKEQHRISLAQRIATKRDLADYFHKILQRCVEGVANGVDKALDVKDGKTREEALANLIAKSLGGKEGEPLEGVLSRLITTITRSGLGAKGDEPLGAAVKNLAQGLIEGLLKLQPGDDSKQALQNIAHSVLGSLSGTLEITEQGARELLGTDAPASANAEDLIKLAQQKIGVIDIVINSLYRSKFTGNSIIPGVGRPSRIPGIEPFEKPFGINPCQITQAEINDEYARRILWKIQKPDKERHVTFEIPNTKVEGWIYGSTVKYETAPVHTDGILARIQQLAKLSMPTLSAQIPTTEQNIRDLINPDAAAGTSAAAKK